MRDLDFQNPQSAGWCRVQRAKVATLVDRVRKVADAMALDCMIESIPQCLCALVGKSVQGLTTQALRAPRIGDFVKQRARRFRTGPLLWRVTSDKRIAYIALVTVEHQPNVDKVAIVLTESYRRIRFLSIRLGRVRTDANQYRMPKPFRAQFAEYLGRFDLGFVLADTRTHALADAVQRGPAFSAGMLHKSGVVPFADGLECCGIHCFKTQ